MSAVEYAEIVKQVHIDLYGRECELFVDERTVMYQHRGYLFELLPGLMNPMEGADPMEGANRVVRGSRFLDALFDLAKRFDLTLTVTMRTREVLNVPIFHTFALDKVIPDDGFHAVVTRAFLVEDESLIEVDFLVPEASVVIDNDKPAVSMNPEWVDVMGGGSLKEWMKLVIDRCGRG